MIFKKFKIKCINKLHSFHKQNTIFYIYEKGMIVQNKIIQIIIFYTKIQKYVIQMINFN